MTVVPVTATSSEDVEIVVQAIHGGHRRVLVRGGSDARLLSTGHLVYTRSGTLFAVAIDPKRFELNGSPVPMVEGVVAQFDVADNGTLVFMPGTPADSPKRTLVWVDRQGREEPLSAKPRAYHHLRLSPDGRQIAVEIRDEENDIWTWDLVRKTLTRLTIGPSSDGYPVWTHDGRHVIYRSTGARGTTMFRRAADGTGSAATLLHAPADISPQSLSQDDKQLVYRGLNPKTGRDLMLLPLDPTGSPTPLIQTEFTEDNGHVSPDGRWIAYESNESGAREVFVRPFPAVVTS
jgi:serine/threonine-protein kinase